MLVVRRQELLEGRHHFLFIFCPQYLTQCLEHRDLNKSLLKQADSKDRRAGLDYGSFVKYLNMRIVIDSLADLLFPLAAVLRMDSNVTVIHETAIYSHNSYEKS